MTKRNLMVVPVPNSTLHAIAWQGGGSLPERLSGQYTSPTEAQMAINVFMSEVKPEELVALMKKDDELKKQKTE